MSAYAGINTERRRAFSEAQAKATERDRAVSGYVLARTLGFGDAAARQMMNLPAISPPPAGSRA